MSERRLAQSLLESDTVCALRGEKLDPMRTSHFLVLLGFSVLECAVTPAALAAQDAPLRGARIDLKFDFSAGPAHAGYTRVAPASVYTDDAGFGFEPGAQVAIGDGGNTATSDRPFMFSAKVPEGNYNVTVTIGDSHESTTTTVKTESGRLMLERVNVPGRPGRRTHFHHECPHRTVASFR